MKRYAWVLIVVLLMSGCAGYIFPNYANVSKAIKNRTDYVGLTGYELRKELGSPTDIQVAWSDEKGLVQIFIYATARGTISAALHENLVIDVDYVDKLKKE
ncbi:MAG: hypothetical protein JW938_07155 [Candidatus Omnitrophica bacterium]|nr:hypothetical protein [Candidatus Omnitrophota bacterium]